MHFLYINNNNKPSKEQLYSKRLEELMGYNSCGNIFFFFLLGSDNVTSLGLA